jgi:AraC family transcriptional regulator of adaptative response/methylated-DNA-[protein]-cysteine methyltransferase
MPSDYYRIETAIRYLEENFRDQPSLEDLAAHLDLSPFHFQRVFKRWAGITPKRFLQFLTIDHAKRALRESQSVLDAAYESGLSSPGRLHDLFVSIDSVTPGEYKNQGDGLEIRYGFHDSPFGDCLIATTDRGVCGLSFVTDGGRTGAVASLEKEWSRARLVEKVDDTLPLFHRVFGTDGRDYRRPIQLLLKGTEFQVSVWRTLLEIPVGHLWTYGDVARRIGLPSASRAVGQAVGSNPIAYLVPCHRIIRAGGEIGGYYYGTAKKRAILCWEAARTEPVPA